MKKTSKIVAIVCLVFLTACNFSKSVSTDLMTGLSTKGDGLSAENVYIANGEEKVMDNTFLYGQKIFTNFVNMKGFVVENDQFYPEMEVFVVSRTGDTVLQNRNLLKGKGLDAAITSLNGNLILATPIHSGEEYTVQYNIRDTKGDGVFHSELELKIEKDPLVRVSENGLSINEAYVFNQNSRKVITNGEIVFDTDYLIDLQGIDGYTLRDGRPDLSFSMKVTDAKGEIIVEKDNLLGEKPMDEAEIKKGMASTLRIGKGRLASPITWNISIKDNNSVAALDVQAILEVK